MYITKTNNAFNTPRHDFNCGGFALGTYDWVCLDSYVYCDDFSNDEELEQAFIEETDYAVEEILKLCPKSRIINDVNELKENEFAVYFRLSDDGDYHFVKRMHNGELWHKQGVTEIGRFYGDVEDDWCCRRYCGPVIIFALDNIYYR